MNISFPVIDSITAIAWGAVLGLVFGSYLATLVVRAGKDPDVFLKGRSCCDACGRQLRWFELLPVVSYLAFRSRCRTCKCSIAGQHIAIEAGCGLLGAVCFAVDQPHLAPIGWLILTLAFYDGLYLWLPNRLVVALAAAALVAPAYDDAATIKHRLAGGAIGFFSLWLVSRGYLLIRGRRGLGGGDPKMFGALGLWAGLAALPTLILLACVIGLIDAARRSRTVDDLAAIHLPFGTYLAGASLLMVGRQIFAA